MPLYTDGDHSQSLVRDLYACLVLYFYLLQPMHREELYRVISISFIPSFLFIIIIIITTIE